MKKTIKSILLFLSIVGLVGCGSGGSDTSTAPNSSDSQETKLLKSLIVGKTLHQYDGYIYNIYEFKSDGDVLYQTYYDGSTTFGNGNTSYSISNGVFTLEWPTYIDTCTLESNTTTQINMKCKDAKNLILWTSKQEAKAHPFDRN